MDAVATLHHEVRAAVRQRAVDPGRELGVVRQIVADALDDYTRRSDAGIVPVLPDPDEACARIIDALAGWGPLQGYLDDPSIEEVWANEPGRLFISRNGRPELTTTVIEHEDMKILIERMLRSSGRRLDMSSPFVDAQLPSGERLHVVIPPITGGHWAMNIRKHMARASRIHDLVALGSLSAQAADFLHASVQAGLNIVVSGATQAGKTTAVRALCGSIPASERIITCEEVFELGLRHRDVVAMQTRPENIEGRGEVTLRRLVKESLRMRPERLIIGEVREAEALDLLIAMNAGLPAMSTIHANSAREAIIKLCTLPLLAGENVSAAFVLPTVAAAVDLIIHLDRDSRGRRRVREIVSVPGRVDDGVVELSHIFRTDPADPHRGLVRASGHPVHPERYERAGFDLAHLLAPAGGH